MAGVRTAALLVLVLGAVSGLQILSLDGSWTAVNSNHSIQVAAKVPGSIYTDLVKAGILGDPYYGFHDTDYRWVAYDNWTFSRSFQVPASMKSFSKVMLVMEGLDTVADIWVNDQHVGAANNMFIRYDIDVTDKIQAGLNKIQLGFTSPVKYAAMRADQYPYPVPPKCNPPELHGECNFNFIRKEACSFSWDWGPAFPTVGIWKNISLEAYNTESMRYITVAAQEDEKGSGLWLVVANVFFSAMQHGVGVLEMKLLGPDGIVMLNTSVHVPKEEEDKIHIQLEVPKKSVELWWPNGFGQQTLYDLEFIWTSAGEVSKKWVKFGFRTVELIQDPVGDSGGLTFYFKINGLPIFMRGSNWIPPDSFQERITEDYLRKLLGSAKAANMNMLRVWGGGVYESELFYSIADELGIMIWQDFMFACSMYPTSPDFLQNVSVEVRQQVRRLSHHPSIAVWAGNNEDEAALSENWYGTAANFSLYHQDYVKLDIDTIRRVVLEEDMSRPFVASSPSNGLKSEQEGWVAKDPQSTMYGDIHHYDYSSDLWNWQAFPVPRFASEYGIQSWCSLETVLQVTQPSDLGINSSFAYHRQHHASGNAQMLLAQSYHWKVPRSPTEEAQFKVFIYLSQVYQAMGIKTETEVYRRNQFGDGPTMGALYWQLNDIWQAPTWASIEYGGKWKMLHYYARNFFNHTLVSPYLKDDTVIVHYIEDPYHAKMTSREGADGSKSRNNVVHSVNYDAGVHIMNNKLSINKQHKHLENDILISDKTRKFSKIYHNSRLQESKLGPGVSSEGDQLTLTMACYSWAALKPLKTWNVPFTKPNQPSGVVYNRSLSKILGEAGCPSANHCFLHFSLGGDIYGPTNVLLLSNFTTAVGMVPAKVEIMKVTQVDDREFSVVLTTNQIALFVWLEAAAVPGYFSNNGFFMVQSTITIQFNAWPDYKGDLQDFTKSLSVMSMMDIYE